MKNEQDAVRLQDLHRLPLQAAPVVRGVVASAVSGEAGLEAADHNDNDPVNYFIIRF